MRLGMFGLKDRFDKYETKNLVATDFPTRETWFVNS